MKLHKQLKWLHPYLEVVTHIVPLEKLMKISLTFYEGKRPPYVGLCTAYDDSTYTISIRMPDAIKDKIPLEGWAQEEILCHLAHELAHMTHWDHTTERFLLETFIYYQFATVLHRLGYEQQRNKLPRKRKL